MPIPPIYSYVQGPNGSVYFILVRFAYVDLASHVNDDQMYTDSKPTSFAVNAPKDAFLVHDPHEPLVLLVLVTRFHLCPPPFPTQIFRALRPRTISVSFDIHPTELSISIYGRVVRRLLCSYGG